VGLEQDPRCVCRHLGFVGIAIERALHGLGLRVFDIANEFGRVSTLRMDGEGAIGVGFGSPEASIGVLGVAVGLILEFGFGRRQHGVMGCLELPAEVPPPLLNLDPNLR